MRTQNLLLLIISTDLADVVIQVVTHPLEVGVVDDAILAGS